MNEPKVLVTNLFLRGRSGTETHTRDLLLELRRRELSVALFSPDRRGPLAAEIQQAGVPVVQDPRDCPFQPDLIHGHHNFALAIALQAFPDIRAIFVCHDAVAWHDRAPRLANIVRWYGVDELCRRRVSGDAGISLDDVPLTGNGVDLRRFRPRSELPRRPRRALILNHTASESNFVPVVRQFCADFGLELAVRGAYSHNVAANPELELPAYDLVFAKGRCAMEAIACGCAVVLCGIEGMGPLVSAENFPQLRRWNFGRQALSEPHSRGAIEAAIDQYDPERIAALTGPARDQLSLERIGEQWLREYQAIAVTPLRLANRDAWVDEWQQLYTQLDRLHTLEYQLKRNIAAAPK